jgi:hypothetical protein
MLIYAHRTAVNTHCTKRRGRGRVTYLLRRPVDTQSCRLVVDGLGDHMEVYVVYFLVGPSAVVLRIGRSAQTRNEAIEVMENDCEEEHGRVEKDETVRTWRTFQCSAPTAFATFFVKGKISTI